MSPSAKFAGEMSKKQEENKNWEKQEEKERKNTTHNETSLMICGRKLSEPYFKFLHYQWRWTIFSSSSRFLALRQKEKRQRRCWRLTFASINQKRCSKLIVDFQAISCFWNSERSWLKSELKSEFAEILIGLA